MAAHCFYIDGVKSFPINEIVFVHAGCLNPHICPSTLPITPGNPPLSWKPSLDYLQFGGRRFWARASNTSFTTLETEDFGRPTVSPMGCRKRPLTKKRNATRICSVGDSAWFLFVCRCRSFSKISVKNSKESWPNRSLLRSSLSEKSSKKIRADETFFRVFGHPNVGKPRHPSSYLGVRGIVAVFKKMFGFSGLLNCLRCKAQKKKNYNP